MTKPRRKSGAKRIVSLRHEAEILTKPQLEKLRKKRMDELTDLEALALSLDGKVRIDIAEPGTTDVADHAKTRGGNIERLRKACGWTYAELASEARIDKSLVFRHTQGAGCSLYSLKRYAKAFSHRLGQRVSHISLDPSITSDD